MLFVLREFATRSMFIFDIHPRFLSSIEIWWYYVVYTWRERCCWMFSWSVSKNDRQPGASSWHGYLSLYQAGACIVEKFAGGNHIRGSCTCNVVGDARNLVELYCTVTGSLCYGTSVHTPLFSFAAGNSNCATRAITDLSSSLRWSPISKILAGNYSRSKTF